MSGSQLNWRIVGSSLATRIHLLDPHTVNQIAAGEVVERPASVVKELVENSLDAGSSRIEIELVDSGRTLIRVSDNGQGMTADDARFALQRHATSKISSSEDLLGVRTLGFRGEALPSVASVSHLTLSTAVEDGLRTVLKVEGSVVSEPAGDAGPKGTEIRVEELFFNTPARLKFLKSDTTELGACLEVVSKYAIGYPHVAFLLTHNGQLALQTNGDGDGLGAVADVWGREVARTMARIDSDLAGMRIRGYVSPPHVTKPSRAYQYLFVNGRPVRTRMLTASVDQAFRDLTPEKRYPLLVLEIEIDPARVDVNVSPTKSEVKFQSEGQAFDAVRMSLKSALMEHGMMPDAAGIAAANEALAAVQVSPRPPSAESWPNGRPPPSGPSIFDAAFEAQRPLSVSAEVPLTSISHPTESNLPFASLLDGLRIIGQAMNTFIVAETRHGLVIIDQHVAHERILYEYLCGLKGPTAIEKQSLLIPQTLHLDKRSAVLLRDRIGEIIDVGFDLEPFGGESYVVRAAPAALRGKDPLRVLKDLVEELVESTVTRRLVPTREQIWITSSCKMAVKAGDPLSHAEMEKLVTDLALTENPYLCPHGRPITITLSTDAILRMFKRT